MPSHGRWGHEPRIGLWLFIALTVLLSTPLWIRIAASGTIEGGAGGWVGALMWCPALAALATAIVTRRPLGSFGWRPGRARWLLFALAIPLFYAGLAYLAAWSLGLGAFYDPSAVHRIAVQLGSVGAPDGVTIGLWLLTVVGLNVPVGALRALGEEIGWRGFLVPELLRRTQFTSAAAWSALIWWAWHIPLLGLADPDRGTPLWFALACFGCLVLGLSFALAWLRLRANSLWPAVILHSAHNAVVQSFLTPLTAANALTPYVITETGAALAVAGLALAFAFRRDPTNVAARGAMDR